MQRNGFLIARNHLTVPNLSSDTLENTPTGLLSATTVSKTEATVTFSAKDYKNQGLWKEITISGEEFIRRFLMHVPPKRFVRIRHYGLLSSRNKKKKITLCRNILGCKKYISKLKDMDAPAIIRLLYNKDICKCSSCGGKIIPLPTEQHFIKPKPHMLC